MPATVTIDFSEPGVRANPYPVYEQLRAETPVAWNATTRSWLVSRYDDLVGLFTDARLSSARQEAIFASLSEEARAELAPVRRILGSRMLLTDPPEHTRLKNLVMKAFSSKMTESRRARIQELCDTFLDTVAPRGEMDVMRDLAAVLPSWVIADLLGVPKEDQPQFTRWAADQVSIYDRPGTVHDRLGVLRRGQASMLEMRAYLEAIIDARRAEPRDDLITNLVQAEEQGDQLTTEELVIMVVALLIGGNNSTAHLIGNAVLTLLRRPDELAALRAQPERVRGVIEEVLRFESPVQATSRVVREPLPLDGAVLQPGDSVHLLIGSANRDPAQFSEPERFDPARHPNRHLTFAHGAHFCLGSSTARATAQIAVLTLAQRFPALRPARETTVWAEGFSFRHLKTLPVLL